MLQDGTCQRGCPLSCGRVEARDPDSGFHPKALGDSEGLGVAESWQAGQTRTEDSKVFGVGGAGMCLCTLPSRVHVYDVELSLLLFLRT